MHIGNHWAGGTEADVFVTLYGERGDTGERMLYKPSAGEFRQGKVTHFNLASFFSPSSHLQELFPEELCFNNITGIKKS